MKTNYFEIRGRLWGIALILSLPLIGHAQSFDMSQIETKIRAFQIQNSKTASTEKLEILDAKKKNKMPLSPTGNFEKQNPAEKLLKPQWFSPEFQKALTSGGVGTGGGDDDGAKFRAYAALGVDQLKDRFTADQSALIKEALSKARILMVDEKQFAVLGEVTQDSVALNNPETGIVTVSRDRWHQVERKRKAMSKTISTHEVLSLVKMESTGQYDHSSEILVDEMKKQKPSQVKVLFSKYADSTRTGYDWDSALEICERVKTDNEK
ncbi:MAG TPA: hypothetical protein VN132_15595, partial [Bdellovibrio sp.]|nr:hypothetical protein [Bdellovibrio sp.]